MIRYSKEYRRRKKSKEIEIENKETKEKAEKIEKGKNNGSKKDGRRVENLG